MATNHPLRAPSTPGLTIARMSTTLYPNDRRFDPSAGCRATSEKT
jgi:hypothetical protein